MTKPLEWKRTHPVNSGFFQYRVLPTDDTEVVHIYRPIELGGAHSYKWSSKKALLMKRMHEGQAVDAVNLAGHYLCEQGSKVPVPIDLKANGNPEPVKKKKAKPPESLAYVPPEKD